MITFIVNIWWRIVWWFKHRGGYIDLGKDVSVTGVVVKVEQSSDGDVSFDVKLDLDCAWANVTFGGQHTHEPGAPDDTIHCEIVPWQREVFPLGSLACVKVGARLRIAGRWGLDAVHAGRGQLWDILRVLFAAAPVLPGWCEIHPVTRVEVL